MANVIIGIHGLGNKVSKEALGKWWKQSMIEGLTNSNLKTGLPKFELVYWADVMYGYTLSETETNPASPYYLEEKYVEAPKTFLVEDHGTRKKVIDFLTRQMHKIFLNEDFSLNYSFISDSIVSKYFRDLEIYYSEDIGLENTPKIKAKDQIRQRLLKTLEKYKDDNIMLICHSMGSIVAFDVLTFLAPRLKIDTFITMGSPLGLPIVISKIAAEQKKRLNHKSHLETPPGIVKNWYNFSDIMDKVAFDYSLSDDFSGNRYGVKPIDFLVVNNYEINGVRNPHKSYGYLRTPEFSKVLNDFILSEKVSLKDKVVRKTVHIIRGVKAKLSTLNEKSPAA